MNTLNLRRTQTQVKHEILTKYLDTWGGIIVNGLVQANPQHLWKFVYVDCFAFKGKYEGDEENYFRHDVISLPVYGSPIIGIKALDKLAAYASKQGIKIETNIILIEKEISNFRDLQNTLRECGFDKRVKETLDFSTLNKGEIALVNKDSTTIVDKLTNYTDRLGVWAFYLIDPWGPSGIPYEFVKKIVNGNRHDTMINFIYEDLVRKAGMAVSADLPPQHSKLVDHWRIAFGGARWDQIILKTVTDIRDYCYWRDMLGDIKLDSLEEKEIMTDEELVEIKEWVFVNEYQKTLASMDPSFAIKLTALQFPDKDRTMFYLFLTTHDPTGALSLNKILFDAKYLELELRYRVNALRSVPPGQMSFWDPIENMLKPTADGRPSIEIVADEILTRLHGKVLNRKEVYFSLVDTIYFPTEINNALKLLIKKGRVLMDGNKLTHRTRLTFSEKQED